MQVSPTNQLKITTTKLINPKKTTLAIFIPALFIFPEILCGILAPGS